MRRCCFVVEQLGCAYTREIFACMPACRVFLAITVTDDSFQFLYRWPDCPYFTLLHVAVNELFLAGWTEGLSAFVSFRLSLASGCMYTSHTRVYFRYHMYVIYAHLFSFPSHRLPCTYSSYRTVILILEWEADVRVFATKPDTLPAREFNSFCTSCVFLKFLITHGSRSLHSRFHFLTTSLLSVGRPFSSASLLSTFFPS